MFIYNILYSICYIIDLIYYILYLIPYTLYRIPYTLYLIPNVDLRQAPMSLPSVQKIS